MKYTAITSPDINNGLGFRVTLWVSGCPHHCLGCHNQELWDENIGKDFELDKVFKELSEVLDKPYIKGLTLCGGEPLDINNQDKLDHILELLIKIQERYEKTKDIWAYSGSTYEELMESKTAKEILNYIDVLVDGKYIQELRNTSLAFRGSENQRVIDVQKSLVENKIVLL